MTQSFIIFDDDDHYFLMMTTTVQFAYTLDQSLFEAIFYIT